MSPKFVSEPFDMGIGKHFTSLLTIARWIGTSYYSYTFPSPSKMEEQAILPAAANSNNSNDSPKATLRFEDVRISDDPRASPVGFVESAYHAGAGLAGWKVVEHAIPSLDEL